MTIGLIDQTFEEFEKFCSDLRTSNDLWRYSEDETLSKIEDKTEEIKNNLKSKIEARIKELESKLEVLKLKCSCGHLFKDHRGDEDLCYKCDNCLEFHNRDYSEFTELEGRIAELKEMLGGENGRQKD